MPYTEDEEVSVTMLKWDWRIVEEFFINTMGEDDWAEDGHLDDEELEAIWAKLKAAIE